VFLSEISADHHNYAVATGGNMDKHKVRQFMKQREQERKVKAPVPTPEEIRRQLGFGLLPNNSAECAR
jgi:hypothetical protein